MRLLISLSVSGGILALLLFAIKPLIKNRLPKAIQYYLWLVVLLRLALPFSFETSVMNTVFRSGAIETVTADTARRIQTETDTFADKPEVPASYPLPGQEYSREALSVPIAPASDIRADAQRLLLDNLIYIWLTGALVSVAVNLAGYFRFIVYTRSAAPASEDELIALSELCHTLNIRRRVALSRSRYAPTPVLAGLLRPRIILPDNAVFSAEQLQNILMHELTHLKRRDVAVKWFAMLVTAAHWFNPAVYFVRREINRACELSCDEAVIKRLDARGKQSYGDTLISAVAGSRYPAGAMSTTMCEEKKTLRERLVSIMQYKTGTKTAMAVSAILLLAVAAAALALGASVGERSISPGGEPDGTSAEAAIDLQGSLIKTNPGTEIELKDATVTVPARLNVIQYAGFYDFCMTVGDLIIGGVETVSAETMDQINHAILLSSEELDGFTEKTVKRVFERDYPAASGETGTYKEMRIAMIRGGIACDMWLNLDYGTEDELMMMAESFAWKQDSGTQQAIDPSVTVFGELDGVTAVEIKYSYFNSFEDGYKPYYTDDSAIIAMLTGMMANAVSVTAEEAGEVDRPNNPVATLTVHRGGERLEIPYIMDTLYDKSVFNADGGDYMPSYDMARLVQNLEAFRPNTGAVESSVRELLNRCGWTPAFLISSAETLLPDNLLYKGGKFPDKLYWSHNLELSKDIGLDFSEYLSRSVTAERYYLVNSIPNSFYPRMDAFAVVLKDRGQIIGAYLHTDRGEFACSLAGNSFDAITGLAFEEWFAANNYDMTDPVNIANAALTPEQVAERYIEAMSRDDGSIYQYMSVRSLKNYLFMNNGRELYNRRWPANNTSSVKLLKLEKTVESANRAAFNIEIDLKVKQVTTTDSGIYPYTLELERDGAAGWKVTGMGH